MLLLSLFSLTVFAEDTSTISITIDLSGYAYAATGVEAVGNSASSTVKTEFTIAAGGTKTFTYPAGNSTKKVITLNLNSAASASSWQLNGEKQENGTEYKVLDNNTKTRYLKANFSATTLEIATKIGPAATWVIAPNVATGGVQVSAKSADEQQGSATAVFHESDSTYELVATAADGYSFDYWSNSNDSSEKIYENHYMISTPTESVIYLAHFREWIKPEIAVDPEGLTAKNGDSLVSIARIEDDKWKLTAARSAPGYSFVNWSCNEDPSFKSEEYAFEATLTESRHYVAHYLSWQITGLAGIRAGGSSDWATSEKGSRPLIAGTSVSVAVQFTYNGAIPHSWMKLYAGSEAEVKAGTATLLTQREGEDSERDSAFDESGNAKLTVDPWPEGVTQITALAYTDGCEEHYFTIDVETALGAEGLPLSYLTSPRNCSTSATDPGPYNPDIYGAAAVQNAETGEMELYVAGIGGVYQYVGSNGTTDFVRMAGMEDLNFSGDNDALVSSALGVGGNGTAEDGITSLVRVYQDLGGNQGGTVSYEVRWYNAEEGKWTTVNTVPKDKYPSTAGWINKVLIMSSDEIWTSNAYYDGVEWTLHGLSFDTFEKVNSTTAYATTTNGTVYKLNAKRSGVSDSWTQVDLGGKLLGSRYDGALAVKLTSGGFAILNADGTTAATYPEITPDIFGDVWTKDGAFKPQTNGVSPVKTVGFGGDGNVYALVEGTGRNYVVRADGESWTLMDTVEAFDIGGANEMEKRPTVPSRIASFGEGISMLYGKKGSLYLHAQDFTVTFNSNGGSAVSPITGQAWSSFVMPIPTKSGMSFAGWYTDAGLTKLYANPVIPAANLTLYAKWTETSTDRWAEDREKALKQLDDALSRMEQTDYSEANWQRVLVEYENGKYAIAIADPQPASEDLSDINKAVQDTIYAALNTAIERMNGIPVLNLPPIDVVVSMDAQTLGLGYMIKPTVVHTTKYTLASTVITDAIVQNIKEQYNLDLTGRTTYHESEPDGGPYAYMNTGSVLKGFYLAQVYWPNQQNAKIAQYILDVCGDKISETQVEKDKTGKYLGEFDYYNMSGWMYSISDWRDSETLPSFPGVGAAGWRMRDGEVMRWQFTVYGYGSDLNADNSAWGSASITGDSGDKTELTYKIAQMREEYKDKNGSYKAGDDELETSRIYMNVFDDVLCDPLANQAKLDAAVADLDLVAAELANADKLTEVTDKILAMGTVKLENGKLVKDGEVTAESGPKIEEARKAYAALTDEQKNLFDKAYPEYLEALEAAEKAYEQVKDEEAAKKAAAEVDAMIDALPDPDDITLDDKDAIDAAMKAYEDLSDTAKGYVENHDKLVACKEAYDKLNDKPNPPTPPTPPTPSKPTTPSKPKDDKPTTGSSFTDVPAGSWYEDAVNYVSEKGLMNGTSKNGFSPNATTTRGMIVTILARVEGVNTNGTPWYAAGQKWAMDNGISDGTNMTGEVTREQLAAILYRYAKLKGYDTSKSNKLDSFKDAGKVSSWAVEAMQWANAEGLINGKSNSMLDPQGKATRAETAAILMRFMENIAK